MEADNIRNPGKPTVMAGSCTSGRENNHLVSADVLRPYHRPPSASDCREVALNAKRHSDHLAKLGRLTTDQLSTALRAVGGEVEKQKRLKTKNNNNRPCNTERHHKNSNVTNASSDHHSDLLAKLGRLTTDQLSTSLRAVAEVEKQKKLKKKNNNNRPCNTERFHKDSNVTNASADRQLTRSGLQPCLRADAPPWSPDSADVSMFHVESSSIKADQKATQHEPKTKREMTLPRARRYLWNSAF